MKRNTICFTALLSAGLLLSGCGMSSKDAAPEQKAGSDTPIQSNTNESSAKSAKENVSPAAKKEHPSPEKDSKSASEKSSVPSSSNSPSDSGSSKSKAGASTSQGMPAYDGLQGSGGSLEKLANGPEKKVPAEVKKEVLAMLKKHIDASNRKDLTGYMATLSKHHADLEKERQLMKESFASGDVKTTLLQSKIVAFEKNTVTVYAETKIALNAPKPMAKKTINRSLYVFTKDPDGWRLLSSTVQINTEGKME